jgi:hypothetical protein
MDINISQFDRLYLNYSKDVKNIILLDKLDYLVDELKEFNYDIGNISLKIFLIELCRILMLNIIEISYISILFKRLIDYSIEDISNEDKLFIIAIITKNVLDDNSPVILDLTFKKYTYIERKLNNFINIIYKDDPSLFDISFIELNSKYAEYNESKKKNMKKPKIQLDYNTVTTIICKEFLKNDKRINKNLCKKFKYK